MRRRVIRVGMPTTTAAELRELVRFGKLATLRLRAEGSGASTVRTEVRTAVAS